MEIPAETSRRGQDRGDKRAPEGDQLPAFPRLGPAGSSPGGTTGSSRAQDCALSAALSELLSCSWHAHLWRPRARSLKASWPSLSAQGRLYGPPFGDVPPPSDEFWPPIHGLLPPSCG